MKDSKFAKLKKRRKQVAEAVARYRQRQRARFSEAMLARSVSEDLTP